MKGLNIHKNIVIKMQKEAKARIKINKLLELAGWRFLIIKTAGLISPLKLMRESLRSKLTPLGMILKKQKTVI